MEEVAASIGSREERTKKSAADSQPGVDAKPVHVKIEEKIRFQANRDGGLEEMEVKGNMFLHITDLEQARIKLQTSKNDDKAIPYQTHPQINKKVFNSSGVIGLKKSDRPFPLNQDVGVLKWRFATADEDQIPLSINAWPSMTDDGAEVNIELSCCRRSCSSRVVIAIPLPQGCSLVVNENDGSYEHDTRNNQLLWSLPVIDDSNAEGSLEFAVGGAEANDEFFPIEVDFVSGKTFAELELNGITTVDDGEVDFSSTVTFSPESYSIS